MSGLLHGRTVVVTGAASGIGAATTRLLLSEGVSVLATDIDSKRGERLVRELEGLFPNRVRFLRQDVSLEEDWIRALDEAESSFGPLDVLVNNAGVLPALIGLAETTLEEWRRVMSVNLDGVFLGVKHAFRKMSGRGGAIVNVSSVAGLVGMPLTGAYAPSKGGVLLLTKAAALEGAKFERPIRVNAVHPGYIQTDMTAGIADVLGGERFERRVHQVVPLKALGSPEQVAEAIAFLASDKSKFTTGSSLVVDGGWTAQ
jgi:NAD(P)-dependent dehydrogenase (short-subunit alcohol dehydrogenase family)